MTANSTEVRDLRDAAKLLVGATPDGHPIKDVLALFLSGSAQEEEGGVHEDKWRGTRQRVEALYHTELELRGWLKDGSVEEVLLDVISAAFIAAFIVPTEAGSVTRSQDRVHKLFAAHAKKLKPRPPNSVRPRTLFTDKKTFVRAFLRSGQTKYAFTKRVAGINAALPMGDRFGCLSTTREEVETQLDRALDQWGDIVREEMSGGQK
jgi:hypothetical protein